MSVVFGHFRELGLESVRRGVDTFTFDPLCYVELSRPGFTLKDELEAFCWLYGATFWPNVAPRSVTVRVPERVFWEHWLEQLSDHTGQMEQYLDYWKR